MSTTYSERITKLPLDVFRAEREWRKTAKRRTGAEWRALIDAIHGRRIRIQVACIVWWDFDGNEDANTGFKDLDDLRNAWTNDQNADRHAVREALVAIGYPARIALKRTEESVWRGFSLAEGRKRGLA